MNRRVFLTGAAAFAVAGAGGLYFLQTRETLASGPVFTGTTPGVAINGYDTVSYITEGKPVEGSNAFKHSWKGVEWRFASAENKALFMANPEKYAPQYGGYCAYAMAAGNFYGIDPDVFTIKNGKLYLNYSAGVQKKWEKKQAEFIIDADKNYPNLVDLAK